MNNAHTAENQTPNDDDIVVDKTFKYTFRTSGLLGSIAIVTGMTIGAVVAAAVFAAKN